jgi:hypothetical protein
MACGRDSLALPIEQYRRRRSAVSIGREPVGNCVARAEIRIWGYSAVPQQTSVQSSSGRITVRATDRGLPTALTIDRAELRRPPQELADEILALCRLSALHSQLGLRHELVEQGFDAAVLAALNLPTVEDVCHADRALRGDSENDDLSPNGIGSI